MTPSPFDAHQRIIKRLTLAIEKYLEKNESGELFLSPLDVILEENQNRLQPDLIFVKKENMAIVKEWIRGVPDLVIEVVSRGSVVLDTVTKKEIYKRYKVPEFWLIFPEEYCIEVFTLQDDRYKLFSDAEEKGSINSSILNNFSLDIEKIFQKL